MSEQDVAYDYDTQQWVHGEAARVLRAKQDAETQELVSGPLGAEFTAFISKKNGVK